MYIPVRLKIVNLLSHRETVYDFVEGRAVMVVGENRDDEGQDSNGSGKSGIIEGISLAITGSAFRKVKDCDLIYYGEEFADVEFTLRNPTLRHSLKIVRTLYSNKNKSSILECYREEGDLTDNFLENRVAENKLTKEFPTVRDGNKWLLDQLGVSREDIVNYFIVSKSKSVSFFSQSDTEKKSIVSRFSGTGPLHPIKDEITADVKAIDIEKLQCERELIGLEGRRDAFQEQLEIASSEDQEKLKAGRIESREDQITQHKTLIVQLESSITVLDSDRGKVEKKLLTAEDNLSTFKEVDYTKELLQQKKNDTKYSESILTEVKAIDAIDKDINEFKAFKAEIERNLADSITCPNCSHKFILRDETYNLEEARNQLPIVESTIIELEETKISHKDSIQRYKELLTKINQEISTIRLKSREQEDRKSVIERSIRKFKSEIEDIDLKIQTTKKKIESSITTISELEKEIEGIKVEEVVDPSLEIGKKIAENKENIEKKLEELDLIKEKYVKLKEFEGVFIRFITHLSNKAVKSIELSTNQYLQEMGSNLSIEIGGYKVNSDGSIKEKFTTVVSRDGIPEAFIEGFSEGEQSRINIAATLALNSLLNLSCEHGKGLNFVVLDELMGSLDRLGVGLTMESLSKLNQSILAISHVEPKSPYRHTLNVIKENGYSRVECQD